MQLEKNLQQSFIKFENEVFQLNYFLANHPEVSGEEYQSCEKIISILKQYGIKVQDNFCNIKTAFLGKVIEKKDALANIAILTEYDALPGIGHACGHSASAAISVLSALALKDNEQSINANIDIIGTPDEENVGLKIPMAQNGIFDAYDFVIMVHLGTKNIPNWKFLAFETYDINFIGKPAHAAASPWEGRSALDGLMLSIHAMDMMRKHLKPHTIIEGFIKEGGIATNIIPEKASAKYTFRSNSADYIKNVLIPWVENILEGCAQATQTKCEMTPFGYPFKDMKYLESGTKIIEDIMFDYNMKYTSEEAGGSSDIGNVSYRCPAFHPSVAITDRDIPLHTKEFADIVKSKESESCIRNGARVITAFIARNLENPKYLQEIRDEFQKQ